MRNSVMAETESVEATPQPVGVDAVESGASSKNTPLSTRDPSPLRELREGRGRLSSWTLDGHNLSAVLRCTAKRGSPEAKHLCGDYEVIARYEGDDWKANARLGAAAPDLFNALSECQRALAMLTAPDAIKQTTVLHAYAHAVEAEAAARRVLEAAR